MAPRSLLQRRWTRAHRRAAQKSTTRLAGELLGEQRAEGVGSEVRGASLTSWCSICRRSKCGHDAPTYGLIDSVIGASATPYSACDIDANKPGGSIKIRVKTHAHSLKLHEERLEDVAKKKKSCS